MSGVFLSNRIVNGTQCWCWVITMKSTSLSPSTAVVNMYEFYGSIGIRE